MSGKSPNEKLLDIAYLMDGYKSDDYITRLRSVRYLTTVAAAIGAERTRSELIPFLLCLQ